MDGLFIIEGTKIMPEPELLLVEPFRKIWEEHTREVAIDIIAYIFFMTSLNPNRNPFIGYDTTERSGKILSSLPSGPEIAQELENGLSLSEAMELIEELEERGSISRKFYKSSVSAAQKMIKFFDTFEFSERSSKTGLPLWKPADITRALRETTEVLKTLQSLKEKVQQELFESSRATKQRRVNRFER